jgi:ATP/maltotriose-dependent transcriptional regulator MalT
MIDAPLVGRIAELAELRAALAGAALGRGRAVLVAGEAGIGKTRLVTELARSAREADAAVLVGRCIDLVGTQLPYFALIEALRTVADAPALGEPVAGEPAQMFGHIRGVLETLAAARPVVLVLEDLHWADPSTLDFVCYLARAIHRSRMLLVATYRDDELRPGDPLSRLVVELIRGRDAEVLRMRPLSPPEARHLIDTLGRGPLPSDLAEAVVDRSGGNPFFAEELLAAAERGEEELPRLLRDALLQRVARVDAAGRSVLRAAATIGRDAPYELLAALTALAEPRLAEALRQSVEHGVLVADQETATYRFRHALLAEAVYATIVPGEREWLHERLAEALTDHNGLHGELARHWHAAGRPVEAFAASLRAAGAAEAVCGLAEALQHLERALQLWPTVPDAAAVAGADLATTLARAADLADLTGRGRRAAELVRRAIDLVDAGAEPVRSGLLHERLGSYLLPIGDSLAALDACRRAVDIVPAEPASAERARVLTSLGNALMLSWRHAESKPVCEEALAVAEAIGDPRPALRAQSILGIDLCHLGRPDDALARLRSARQDAFEHGTPRDIAHNHAVHCDVLLLTGRPAEAARVAAEGMACAQQSGVERSFGALLAAYAAEALLETGDWDRAEELLAEAHRSGTAFWAHYPRLLHAQLATARGDVAAARDHLAIGAHGERQPTSAARYARVVAELALWEGRPDDAVAAVEAGLAGSRAGRSASQRVRLTILGLRALADRRPVGPHSRPPGQSGAGPDRDDAVRLVRQARRAATAAAGLTAEAAGWRALAEAEFARLEHPSDPDPWRAAVAAWDALARPYPAAYCRWRLAEVLLGRPGDAGEAVRAAREAHRSARTLRAEPLRVELERLAQRSRLDLNGLPSPGRRPDRAGALGLTDREGQVLLLLTRGYTNRQIADELTISVKTASVHVSHIMRKLGVSRRLDAAAIGHRTGVA